jgi:hypothetical protein
MSKANTLENEQNISEATVFKGFGYDQNEKEKRG